MAMSEATEAVDVSGEPKSEVRANRPAAAAQGHSGSERVIPVERREAVEDWSGGVTEPSDHTLPTSDLTVEGLREMPLGQVSQAELVSGGGNMLTIVTVSAATLLFNRLDQLGRQWLSRRKGYAGGRELSARDRAAGVVDCVTMREFLMERQRLDAVLTSRRAIVKRCRELLISNKELVRKTNTLADLAATDPLTGLKNRRHLHESIDGTLRFAAREGLPTSLIMLDVDHFKSYNDTLGHAAGDHVLRVIAGLLQEGTRPFDVVARYGGEEFVMLLPGANATAARRSAERLRSLFGRNRWPHRPVTASFGIATAEPGAIEVAELLEQADAALYRAKAQGRDRVVHHDDLMPARAVEPAARARMAEEAETDRRNGHATSLIHRNGRSSIFVN
jgi:diguanylate cyclase (GGDEF)-like protein